MGAVALAFVAGTLSVLSPCVLPLLPITVAAALQQHRHGPIALTAGLVVTSTGTGLFFASLGFTTGLDRDVARAGAAVLMALAGAVLLVPRLQTAFARVAAPLASAAGGLATRLPPGLGGQVLLGALLGFVWTPCTGPTLAAAITLATRSESLARAGAVMFVFSVGAVVPVLVLAYGSRRMALGRHAAMARVAAVGKPLVGTLLLLVGALTFTGRDKAIETWMVNHMPAWLLELTTKL
jgi:cytochrome c biogenesis protein CcdA